MWPYGSLSGTGLSQESLTEPQTLTSIRQYITACHNALQLSKDPEIPFRIGSRIPLSAYGMYGFALVCSPTIRTLHRKLQAERASFTQILDDVRCNLAKEYLRSTELRMDDISELVGFSEAANFRHAFRRWTGRTPASFRP